MAGRSTLKYDLMLLFDVLVWGVNFAVVKTALEVMHPHVVNVCRFTVSAAVLGGLYVHQQRKAGEGLLEPLRGQVVRLSGMGLLGYVFYQLCFIVGIKGTTAGSAALIMASAPLWTAVAGRLFRLDYLRGLVWLGLATTLLGTFVIVLGGSKRIDFSDEVFFGNTLILLAAIFWGAYTAFTKPVIRHVTPVSLAFLGLVFALPFLFALGLPHVATVAWGRVSPWVWVALVYSGGLSTGLAMALWNAAVKHVGPSQTAAFGNLVPVIALLSGMVLLGETVTLVQMGGGVLILGGLLIVRRLREPLVPAA